MRVYTTKKSRKEQTCFKCRMKIEVGSSLKYIAPRYGPMKYYHDHCQIRRSDMVSSDKLQRLYQAQESIEDSLSINTDPDEVVSSLESLKTALEEARDTAEEVGQEYQDSADSIHEHFQESQVADDCEEKSGYCQEWQESLDSAVSDVEDAVNEIQSILSETFEPPEENDEEGDEEEDLDSLEEQWDEEQSQKIQEQVDEAVEAASTASGELNI